MRTLYFDCFAGASGDMILGALVAAGVDSRLLEDQLSLLGLHDFKIEFDIVDRSGISATHARVQVPHEHKHRHLADILKIINESSLAESVKNRATKIFSRLAESEAKVHNVPVAEVHFHEVGAMDAIIDVVGAAICFELLGIDRFVSSPLHVGSGTVDMEHGRFPVPPPAVAELLKGAPVYSTDIKGELVTPTGAAIITTVCSDFGPLPVMKLERSGYGAGTRVYEKFPNALRIMIGVSTGSGSDRVGRAVSTGSGSDRVDLEQLWMLESNIDDMSPQVFGHVMERAFDLGALDCYFTPIQMKKNRPGILLSILCRSEERESLSQMVFAETTTLGLRSYQVERRALEREVVSVETEYGRIDLKVARLNGHVVTGTPEYEQCREAALKGNVPLRTVESAARAAFEKDKR